MFAEETIFTGFDELKCSLVLSVQCRNTQQILPAAQSSEQVLSAELGALRHVLREYLIFFFDSSGFLFKWKIKV